ncbi:MAG: adenosylcobinamide-GDP ribazoletransferase [Pseudomonadota bacterium]
MQRQHDLIAAAFQFLTRIPVATTGWEPDRLARAARYFPLVGAAVGGASGFVFWMGAGLLPPMIAAGLAVLSGILLTGALHEDGLADTADALGGHAGRARALEIMRDSRIGTYGAVAIIASIGLRWAALASLAPVAGALALIAASAGGRALMVPVSRILCYARTSGAGESVSDGARNGEILLAALITCVAIAPLGLVGVTAFLLAGLAGWVVLRGLARRLGGYTGDGLGAIEQVGETVMLIVIAASLS